MKRNIFFYYAFILIMGFFASVEKLNLKKYFPTDEQMKRFSFALNSGRSFAVNKNQIIFCDQYEGRFYEFNLNGDFIRTVGRQGQGPGEFNKPYKVFIYNDEIYISDNGNGRIQIFSLKGEYLRQIKLASTVYDMVILDDKLFIGNPLTILRTNKKSEMSIIEIYDLKGMIIKKINDPFPSSYATPIYSQTFSMQRVGDEIHLLQNRGQIYRIYDYQGEKKREFELQYNPLKDIEYKKLKYIFTYQCFYVFQNHIYASVAWRGKIAIFVFDMEGNIKKRLEIITDNKNEINTVDCIQIIDGEKPLMYLLQTDPEHRFIIVEI